MPRLFQPSDEDRSERVELAVQVFGNRAKNEVVRALARHPGAHMGRLVELTGLHRAAIGRHLVELEDLGVVIADLPPDERRGRSVRYSINNERALELLEEWERYVFGDEMARLRSSRQDDPA